MRARDVASKLKRFDAQEKAQKVVDLEQMIVDFEQMAEDLDRQIQAEEDRTGVRDPEHFAYSTFARSAAQRRVNLMASLDDLRARLAEAVEERDAAAAEAGDGEFANGQSPTAFAMSRNGPALAR